MQISLEMRALVPPDVLIQETLGESVLLNIHNLHYFWLDGIGTRMWTVLTTAPSLQSACDTLKAEYDVDAQLLEKDVRELLEKLVKYGLVDVQRGC